MKNNWPARGLRAYEEKWKALVRPRPKRVIECKEERRVDLPVPCQPWLDPKLAIVSIIGMI